MNEKVVVALAIVLLGACKAAPSAPPLPSGSGSGSASGAESASASGSASASPPPADSSFLGRVPAQPMSFDGASWLDRPNRDETQKPEHVLDVIGMHAGQTVADFGCGSGYFTVHMAKRVGPSGRVLALDLQQPMLDLTEKKVHAAKLGNVEPVLVTTDDTKLPPGQLDIVLFVDVYHELAHPLVTMTQVKASLRPGGKVVLVEYRAEDPKLAIKPEHKTTLVQLKKELDAEGYDFVASDESLPEQRIVTFVPRAATPK